ncbi:MAG: DNA primase [Helicobacteraceae bacterium]
MINKASIDNLLATVDIVDLVGSFVDLKKAGANYQACCPFHSEKTASFVVSPAKQIFHCFGCGASGNAVSFVMQHQKLNFPEAIEKIAQHYNFTLEYDEAHAQKQNRSLELFNEFFLSCLARNKTAADYLAQRGIARSSIESFGVGYAPSSAEQLAFARSKHCLQDAIEAGILSVDNRGNYFSRFIERVTFPIYSQSAKLVGFGARTLSNHPAKYVNSPQTAFFNKSRLLYGYHKAKEAALGLGALIVVEGYLDVISLHQAGFKNSVATLGTALTHEHIPSLRKLNAKIILSFDGDAAGLAAAQKTAMLLYKSEFEGGVVIFGGGADPADMVRAGDLSALRELFANPVDFAAFISERLSRRADLSSPKQKQEALKEARAYLKDLSVVFAENLARYLARDLGLHERVLLERRTQRAGQTAGQNEQKTLDILELQLIKTALINKDLAADLGAVSQCFLRHGSLLADLLEGKSSNALRRLEFSQKIEAFSGDEFRKSIVNIRIRHLQQEIKNAGREAGLSFTEKSKKLKKLQLELQDLKLSKGIKC